MFRFVGYFCFKKVKEKKAKCDKGEKIPRTKGSALGTIKMGD